MIIRRNAFFAGLLTLGLVGFGCSSSKNASDAGTSKSGTGGSKSGTGGTGTSGKSGAGGTGTSGKSGTAGTATAGKSGTAGAAGDSGAATPSIKIDSPATGASLGPTATDPNYPNIPVEFTVKNFALMAPGSDMPAGTCAAGVCGHVHLLVDGAACNYTPTHVPYNNAGADSPLPALLGYCPSIAGPHVITLELHNDDHSAVKDSSGTVISDKINITAKPVAVVEADAG